MFFCLSFVAQTLFMATVSEEMKELSTGEIIVWDTTPINHCCWDWRLHCVCRWDLQVSGKVQNDWRYLNHCSQFWKFSLTTFYDCFVLVFFVHNPDNSHSIVDILHLVFQQKTWCNSLSLDTFQVHCEDVCFISKHCGLQCSLPTGGWWKVPVPRLLPQCWRPGHWLCLIQPATWNWSSGTGKAFQLQPVTLRGCYDQEITCFDKDCFVDFYGHNTYSLWLTQYPPRKVQNMSSETVVMGNVLSEKILWHCR